MAPGKNPRMDSKRMPSYCSTAALVVFVALCLVGVWMMTSSTVMPVDIPSLETQSEMKGQVQSGINSKHFEDSSGDVPEEVASLGATANANTDTSLYNRESPHDQNTSERTNENSVEKKQVENLVKVNEDLKHESADKSNTKTANEANRNTEGEKVIQEGGETNLNDSNTNSDNQDGLLVKNIDQNPDAVTVQPERDQSQIKEKEEQNQDKETELNSDEDKTGNQVKDQGSNEVIPGGTLTELLNETNTQNGAWSTQAAESSNEKEVQASSSSKGPMAEYRWRLCNVTAGADYIPCLDNEQAIKKLQTTKHYEHRERHCPEVAPTCLVPLPEGYQRPVKWPKSRDKVWYSNAPHTKLVAVKGHQNWVKITGEYFTFPGGGTQFIHGALHYIDFIQKSLPDIAWGERSRVILDVGCGVASFGGFLFDRDVLTMSFAPKDEHEAQVQFSLERGIPAILAVMGTKRLPFPSNVFDVIHCARCRVPWHIEGGLLLLELNRVLRPGGYFVWSATPVYRDSAEDIGIWNAMSSLTKSMCWKMVTKKKDKVNRAGLAIYRKPTNNQCYKNRMDDNPPICQESDDPNAAWNIPLQTCMHRVPVNPSVRGSQWPEKWPQRLEKTPYWLNNSQVGVYGKAAPVDFQADYEHWKRVVSKSYLIGMGINWSTVRNVMDMRSVYGGFAAALRDMKVWVMNIVPIDSPDTLPIIYERGLFGMYHDWCESFSTYPRSYDLLHADHLFSKLKTRCKLLAAIAEVDRILRPEGKLIVRDDSETLSDIEALARSLHWEIRMTYSNDREGLLCVEKTVWRPQESIASSAN